MCSRRMPSPPIGALRVSCGTMGLDQRRFGRLLLKSLEFMHGRARRRRQGDYSVSSLRESLNEKPRNIGIEYCARRSFNQFPQLGIVARRAEPAPIANYVDVDAAAPCRGFANRRSTREG